MCNGNLGVRDQTLGRHHIMSRHCMFLVLLSVTSLPYFADNFSAALVHTHLRII